MLFEIKYCLPDLQQQLTAFMAHLGNQKIIIALQTSYKDTSSHRGTRWLEMSLQNHFKSNYFHGFLKKWRRNAEGFCMDQCRVITLVSDCNSLGRIVGYAKAVSQLYPKECQCKTTKGPDCENKSGISKSRKPLAFLVLFTKSM